MSCCASPGRTSSLTCTSRSSTSGCHVVETNSFGSIPWVLAEYGISERARELAQTSASIARDVADSYSGDRWVAGSLGPGTKIASLGQISFAEMRDGYQEAAAGLIAGGVDLLIIETVQDLLQAKAAIIACRRAMADAGRQLPLQVQVTIETTGRMLMGSEIGAALTTLDAMRPDVIGLNCATGPAEMGEHVRYLSAHSRVPISCLPNAGLPSVVEGKMHYDLTPDQLAEYHRRFATELGVNVLGGCCGTSPAHLKAVVDALSGLTPPAVTRNGNQAAPRSTPTSPTTRPHRSSTSASARTPTAPSSSGTPCWPRTGTRARPWPRTPFGPGAMCSMSASTTPGKTAWRT